MSRYLLILMIGGYVAPINGYDRNGQQLHPEYPSHEKCEAVAAWWRKQLGDAASEFDLGCVRVRMAG